VPRFGRNAIEVPQIIQELRGLGVTVIFDKENISTADFADEFLLNILSGVAEEESRQTSTNIRWSVGKKMSKGGTRPVAFMDIKSSIMNFTSFPKKQKS
jgi:DNA invertase Pin-like site-specific DNA recombinase